MPAPTLSPRVYQRSAQHRFRLVPFSTSGKWDTRRSACPQMSSCFSPRALFTGLRSLCCSVAASGVQPPFASVGALHLLFAMAASAAPYNAFAEVQFQWQVGFVGFSGRSAALPAILLIAWALTAACLAALQKKGRWLWLMVLGDSFWALNISARMAFDFFGGRLRDDTIQFGEHLTIAAVSAVVIMLLVLVTPFVASAAWSARRVGISG